MRQTVSLRSFPHSVRYHSCPSMAILFAPSVGHIGDWVLIVDGSAQIHPHSRKVTQGSCPGVDGSGATASYMRDTIFQSSALSFP